MFENLKKHKRILVSGPQRSGTRICAKMIAYDTEIPYIDEIDRWPDFDHVQELLETEDKFVLHCPTASRWLHEFTEPCLVVFMIRDVAAIIASQKRIDWNKEEHELQKYGATTGPIARVKYDFWEKVQKPAIANYLEVEYESLKQHPLWVPPDKRCHFHWNQTEVHLF